MAGGGASERGRVKLGFAALSEKLDSILYFLLSAAELL